MSLCLLHWNLESGFAIDLIRGRTFERKDELDYGEEGKDDV